MPSYSYATNQAANFLYKKRSYEEKPGSVSASGTESAGAGAGVATPASASRESGVPQKLQRTDGRQHIPNVVPPKGRVATLTRISGGQRQV